MSLCRDFFEETKKEERHKVVPYTEILQVNKALIQKGKDGGDEDGHKPCDGD